VQKSGQGKIKQTVVCQGLQKLKRKKTINSPNRVAIGLPLGRLIGWLMGWL